MKEELLLSNSAISSTANFCVEGSAEGATFVCEFSMGGNIELPLGCSGVAVGVEKSTLPKSNLFKFSAMINFL